MKTVHGSLLLAALLVGSLGLLSGCTGTGPQKSSNWNMPWFSKKEKPPKPYPNPAKMAVTWTPDTLVQTGRTPTRGFGGRLFFYDEKTRAVPVEGDLTVHAFAENPDGSLGEVKRYHFTAEQFTQHFSQSDLGASYSIWIPWDAVGGEQMRISLVPSFRAVSGRLVQGEQALVGLPGRRVQVENIAKQPDPISEMLAQREAAKSGLTTTTIPLRRDLPPAGQREAAAPLPGMPIAPASTGITPLAEPRQASNTERRPQRLGVVPASAELPMQ